MNTERRPVRIIDEEEIKKVNIPLNICKQWMSARRYAEGIAEAQMGKVIQTLRNNIIRCLHDKQPGYAHDVAIYNDLLRELSPGMEAIIEYNGDDCKFLHQ